MALSSTQQFLLADAMQRYVADQVAKGNVLVYLFLRTATSAQLKTALSPFLQPQLDDAKAQQTNLTAMQANLSTSINQSVSDLQAVVTALTTI